MDMTERERMRMFGVTLKQVSQDTGLPVSDVCRLLNDDLVKNVKSSANKLICEKAKFLEREIAHE
tara:strand:+ start:557 stop:751 length:195 start_codon:yes stop_codon:yes gene_type:complete